MRVLFENKLKGAAFSSLNENTSFPLTSLTHQFLRYKYKSKTYDDLITIILTNDVSADSFWFGYSNASSMVVRIYSSGLVLLKTINVDCTQDNGAEYFTEITNARVIEIEAEAPVEKDLQIGGLAFGIAETFPNPGANFATTLIQNNENEASESGQVASRYVEPILRYDLSYAGVKREDYSEMIDLFYLVGNGHIWCDITEGNHTLYKPIYAVTNLIESPTRSNGRTSFKVTVMEAR